MLALGENIILRLDASNKASKEKAVSDVLTAEKGKQQKARVLYYFTYSLMVQKAKSGKTYIKIIKVKTREGTLRTSDSLTKGINREIHDRQNEQSTRYCMSTWILTNFLVSISTTNSQTHSLWIVHWRMIFSKKKS